MDVWFLEQVGICGEHGGEPSSVAFFAQAGLDYVSCSPFRFRVCTFFFPVVTMTESPNCKACSSSGGGGLKGLKIEIRYAQASENNIW
ncbi:hypothetical protein BHE74_00045895 [Ensete ventricosum]|nr:hypothetical protein GW17_00047671 [Ensete ventricosum]RWW48074.1 hypothetical protein BHE74_00045895 [Ensete ventricosum]